MACSRSSRPSRALALAVAASLAGWATGPARASPPGQCFDLTYARGKVALDARTLLVRVDGGGVVRIDLADQCPGLTRPDPRIVLKARGGSYVCDRFDLDVSVARAGSPIGGVPCTVSSIRRLSRAELAALPKDRRP